MAMRRGALLFWLILAIAACAAPDPSRAPASAAAPSSSPSSGPVSLDLPHVEILGDACAGVGLDAARLTGDPNDPRVAWLATPGGGRQDVVFPPGYQARFVPALEVLDASGAVVARDGDVVDGGCVTGADGGGPLLIGWQAH